jgi:hypothetical protein
MRMFRLASLALLVSASLAGPVRAADVSIVRGEVMHLECPLGKGDTGRGERHAACAMTSARNGEPMVLLTDEAVLIIEGSYVAEKNAKLLDFVGRRVEAKGTVTERDGRKYLNIAAMMVQK